MKRACKDFIEFQNINKPYIYWSILEILSNFSRQPDTQVELSHLFPDQIVRFRWCFLLPGKSYEDLTLAQKWFWSYIPQVPLVQLSPKFCRVIIRSADLTSSPVASTTVSRKMWSPNPQIMCPAANSRASTSMRSRRKSRKSTTSPVHLFTCSHVSWNVPQAPRLDSQLSWTAFHFRLCSTWS